MPRTELPFADGFYVSQSTPFLDKRVVNAYPVIPQSDAISKRALLRTPGIKQIAKAATGASRGAIKFNNGIPYRVIGSSLISTDSVGVITIHGTITGTNDVSIDSNGINIAIQDPTGDSYFFTPSTNTLELNNGTVFLSFGQAKTVTFKDGFYVYTTDSIFFLGIFLHKLINRAIRYLSGIRPYRLPYSGFFPHISTDKYKTIVKINYGVRSGAPFLYQCTRYSLKGEPGRNDCLIDFNRSLTKDIQLIVIVMPCNYSIRTYLSIFKV